MQFGRRKSNPSWMSKASAKVRALWKNPNWVCKQRIKPIKVKIMKTSSQRSNGVTTMGRLADKNILITGGNSGIGLAAAQEFDREGARVAICGLNEGSLQAAKETLGAGSLAVRADVSNLTDLDTMFATIKREFGHLDGVFVNAGYSEFRLFEEVTEQSFDKVIAVNFKGAYFTIQKALPLLRQGSSVIINASVGARKGWPDNLDRLDLQGCARPSRSNPQRRTRGPRDSREYPKPRPDGHGNVRSLPRRRAGRGG